VTHRITLLLEILDQAYGKRAWHGTTLRGALRGLDPGVASWRPGPDRHSIWELILHAAYWKYVVRRHVGDPSPRFRRKPSNWPAPPAEPSPAALKEDIAYLDEEHRMLRDAIVSFRDAHLDRTVKRSQTRYSNLIHGVAAHDYYHTGQIQLLKRLASRV